MKNRTRIVLMVPAAFAVLLAATSTDAVAQTRTITLAFKRAPKGTVKPAIAGPFVAAPVRLDLVDARAGADPLVVGAQKEGTKLVYAWKSDRPVVPAVAEFIVETLRAFSVQVSSDAGVALAIRLTRYECSEKSETFGSSYRGDVGLSATILAPGGETIVSVEAAGTSKDSGADERASICNQVLSNALRDALAIVLAPTHEESRVVPPPPPPPAPTDAGKLLDELSRMKAAGVGDDVLVSYVKQKTLAAPLTAEDVLLWKQKGIPDAAIRAALEAPRGGGSR